jgi:hypothetical protein
MSSVKPCSTLHQGKFVSSFKWKLTHLTISCAGMDTSRISEHNVKKMRTSCLQILRINASIFNVVPWPSALLRKDVFGGGVNYSQNKYCQQYKHIKSLTLVGLRVSWKWLWAVQSWEGPTFWRNQWVQQSFVRNNVSACFIKHEGLLYSFIVTCATGCTHP